MSRRGRSAIGVWLAALAVCIFVIARTSLSTDMSAFLPRSPSPAQQILVDQVRSGVVSRLILLGLDGAAPDTLAALSKALAGRLRQDPAFLSVNNGEDIGFDREREFFWRNRYLLGPDVTAGHFTVPALHQALARDLRLLGSDMAVLIKPSLPHDPTGEILTLIDRFAGAVRPHSRDGVWFSGDEKRAVLVVETRAAGFDIDAQQRALRQIAAAFAQAQRDIRGADAARLAETGPGVFAVHARATMQADAGRFSVIATVLVAALLLFAYRSLRVLLLGLLPVLSGALAGIAAVALGFGSVHGITLGFGVTLIGESVDYAVYLFTQTTPESAPEATLDRIWPTLRLGVLTSIAGFSAMLFSGFTGFAQLGLFSITGLIAAVSVTRWILPALLPAHFATATAGVFAPPLLALMRHRAPLRLVIAAIVLLAALALLLHRGGFWQQDLSSLSPVPRAEQKLDQALRRDVGAPDVRYLVVLTAGDEQQALAASERIAATLSALTAAKALGGFDAPGLYLPSEAVQRARQAALPDADTLRQRLQQATAGLPFRPELFAPFIADIAAARRAPLLTADALPPALRLKLDAVVFPRRGAWTAVLPLHDVTDAGRIADAVAALHEPSVAFVDLKAESDRLLRTYQSEAISLALIGGLVILVLLSVSLRSARRVVAVAAPLAAAVVATSALLTAGDRTLSIFNLVGLLLIVAVGSNYCLFFERQNREAEHRRRSVASLVLANLCTVVGFGILSFSGMAVLHDIGVTVAVGTFLCLIFSAVLTTGLRPAAVPGPVPA